MNTNDKILISLTAGIAICTVMGILLTREKGHECQANVQGNKKLIKDLLEGLNKKSAKHTSLKEEMEEAVKEAFAENQDEYC